MNINKWLQKRSDKPKSKNKKTSFDRQKLIDKTATKAGGIGNIARQRKRQDKILAEIMKD